MDEVTNKLLDIIEALPGSKLRSWNPKGWYKESVLDAFVDGMKFPRALMNLAILKNCYNNFYNLYIWGLHEERASYVHMILFPVITELWKEGKTGELNDRYFPKGQFGGSGCYDMPEDNYTPLYTPKKSELKQIARDLNGKEKTFLDTVRRMIESWDITKPPTQEFKVFQNLTAMLALTLVRGLDKTEAQLSHTFRDKEFVAKLHKLTKWPLKNGYATPHQRCVTGCCGELWVGHGFHTGMLAMIISRWRSECLATTKDSTAQAIIEEGLLNSLKFCDMGLAKLTFLARETLGHDFPKIRDATLTEDSKKSWDLMSQFIERYIDREEPGDTFYWARVIDWAYLDEFDARLDPQFAGIMAGIIASKLSNGNRGVHGASTGKGWIKGVKLGRAAVYKLDATEFDRLMATRKR